MAEEKSPHQKQSAGAPAGVSTESARQPQDVKAQRGGPQTDQISGETDKGAHNQEMENQNPSGNKPDRNQSARQEGNAF